MSDARKQAEEALAFFEEHSLFAPPATASVVRALRALLAEQPGARNLPCFAGCPKTPVCDETYPDPELPDHCERCHHPLVCHPAEPSRPAPRPALTKPEQHEAGDAGPVLATARYDATAGTFEIMRNAPAPPPPAGDEVREAETLVRSWQSKMNPHFEDEGHDPKTCGCRWCATELLLSALPRPAKGGA